MRKLLFLSHRIPYPPDKGDKIRAWHMLEHLMRSHDAYVGCFIDDPADWAHVAALRSRCADLACFTLTKRWRTLRAVARLRPGRPLTLDYFADSRLQRWVRKTLSRERIDLAFAYSSAMAPYLMDVAGPRMLLDLVDVDSAKWTEYATGAAWPMRAVWAREGRTLLAFEQHAAARFDRTLFVSEAERCHFHALAPLAAARTEAVSNGVDTRFFSPDRGFADPYPRGAPRIVFTGAMDYRPNVDAVSWFAAEVLPILRGRATPPKFWIVGANPAAAVLRLGASAGIHVTGRVADTRPYLAHADVVVAPLRIARGIQNKVLEAMAMARPVIATPQAAAGLDAVPGVELLIASEPSAIAGRIGEVLDGRHPAIGRQARRAVMDRYQWDMMLAPLDAHGAPTPHRQLGEDEPKTRAEAAA